MVQPLESRVLAQRFAVQALRTRSELLRRLQTRFVDLDFFGHNAFAVLFEECVLRVVWRRFAERKSNGHNVDEVLDFPKHSVDLGNVLDHGHSGALRNWFVFYLCYH